MDFASMMRRSLAGMAAPSYPPSVPGLVRMDANTNLYGINPAVDKAFAAGAARDVNQYPSGLNDELRSALAKKHGLDPAEIMIGAGSDQIIDVVVRTFCNPDEIVAAPVPTFVMYEFYARVNGARFVGVPLGPKWDVDADALLAAKAKVVFIATPNNPTGNATPAATLERVLQGSRDGIVVIDEAYAELCGQDWIRRVRDFANLVVTRTFSKAYGLAGLRVGYGIAPRPLMEKLYAAMVPFTVSTTSERIAVTALDETAFLQSTLKMLESEKPFLTAGLKSLGFTIHPTDANFILVESPHDPRALFKALRDRGILVRALVETPRLERALRITIGRREHNEKLLAALREILK